MFNSRRQQPLILRTWISNSLCFYTYIEVAERVVNPSVRTGYNMQITTSNSYNLCGDISGVAPNRTTIITCNWPGNAKYVSFHLNAPSWTYLNFYEIEIHGICWCWWLNRFPYWGLGGGRGNLILGYERCFIWSMRTIKCNESFAVASNHVRKLLYLVEFELTSL